MSTLFKSRNALCMAAIMTVPVLFASIASGAQNSSVGEITGTVAEPGGTPVAAAEVALRSRVPGKESGRTVADQSGRYSFSAMPFGVYKLTASAPGFSDSDTKLVILTSANATADLALHPPASGDKHGKSPGEPPPAFTTAGAKGATAPSGYSTGLGSEEAAQVRSSARVLNPVLFSAIDDENPIDCSQQPVLLRKIETSPDDVTANHALARLYLRQGDYLKAIRYYEVARSISPDDFSNTFGLAAANIGAGRASTAAALLEPLLQTRGSDARLLRLLAWAYQSLAENEKSLAMLKKAAAIDPGVENQYACAMEMLQLGALAPANDVLLAAVEAHQDSAQVWFGLGLARYLLDRKDEAINALFRSSKADAGFLPPLSTLAELSGLPDAAEDELRRRIAVYLMAHPEDAQAHYIFALALSKEARRGESADEEMSSQLQRALQLDQGLARAHFLLGEIETEKGDLPEAINQFVSVLKLERANAQAHYRLSLLYRRTGRQDLARAEMETFSALNGSSHDGGSADRLATPPLNIQTIDLVTHERACEPTQGH